MTPIYELSLANNIIQDRLERLEIKDLAENRGDTLTIKINGKGVAKPQLGVPISIKIGYAETTIWDAGTFIVQEVEREEDAAAEGQANILTLRGISQPQGGIAKVQTTYTERVWEDNQNFNQIVSDIIQTAGLTPKIHDSLKMIAMPTTVQRNESDARLLDRLASERNAFVKYHDNEVIIQPYDAEEIGSITIQRNEITSYHFIETQRMNIDKVVTKYIDIEKGKTIPVSAGTGQESIVISTTYPDKETATQVAEARLKKYQRSIQTVTISLPTQAGMFAEKIIELTGFDDAEINQKYIARAVITRLNRKGLRSILLLESIPK